MLSYFMFMIILVYCILAIREQKKKYHQQSLCIIQLYLNRELVTKLLKIISTSTISRDDKLVIVLSKIKEYFDLDEIILFNPNDSTNYYGYGKINETIVNLYNAIFHTLKNNAIDIRKINIEGTECFLYTISVENSMKFKYIIFMQKRLDMVFNKEDIHTLSDSVKVLLSTL